MRPKPAGISTETPNPLHELQKYSAVAYPESPLIGLLCPHTSCTEPRLRRHMGHAAGMHYRDHCV
jgi:hypothetical protein